MNKKGQADNLGLGVILAVFIAVLVGVILLQASAQQVGDTVNLQSPVNITFDAANGTTTSIQGKFWSDLEVYNATNDYLIGSGNYTLTNNVVVDGVETARLTKAAPLALEATHGWLLSGTVQPTTYISDGGGRAVANLIAIFFAIAIALVALVPTLRNKILDVKR